MMRSAALLQQKERGLQSAGRLVSKQGCGIVQRMAETHVPAEQIPRSEKIGASCDDFHSYS